MQPGMELADRYRLQERLGHGGMGEVWRCIDLQLRRPVAVKLLLESNTDPDLAHRFQREATITAGLQHPGITVVHDVGRHDDQLFIVMELLHGTDLAAVLADEPRGLPASRGISLVIQAAQALAAAHTNGIVHRDLKPANLFLLTSGLLKICDFGIAWAVDATSALTATGRIFGTPAYMSPEQWEGAQVDERSDLYSLGCVLHALLTGQPPFLPNQSPLALMRQHLDKTPAGPRALRPDIPAELDRLVLDLLAKNPANRPSSAGLVAEALNAIQSAPPTRANQTKAVVSAGPPNAARLLDDAEQLAHGLTRERTTVLIDVAGVVARTDRVRAEQIARSINSAGALARVARVVARTDPAQAARLLDDAHWLLQGKQAHFSTQSILTEVTREVARTDPAGAARLLDGAEQIARSLTHGQAAAMIQVAEAAAHTDPARAEQIADSLTTERLRAEGLAKVAIVVAPADPDRAEQIASSLIGRSRAVQVFRSKSTGLGDPGRFWAARGLAEVAMVVAHTDQARSARLLDRVEQLTRTITEKSLRSWGLAEIAMVVTRTDPTRAARLLDGIEQLTRTIVETGRREDNALQPAADSARTGGVDKEKVARSITNGHSLAAVAEALAGVDPARAEQYARSITDQEWHADTLAKVAIVVAGTDPAHAEQIARSITSDYLRAKVAEAAATVGPAYAQQIVYSLTDEQKRIEALAETALTAAPTNPVVATGLLENAEELARGLTHDYEQNKALAKIAAATAHIDLARAERIARSITNDRWRAQALVSVADVWQGGRPDPSS